MMTVFCPSRYRSIIKSTLDSEVREIILQVCFTLSKKQCCLYLVKVFLHQLTSFIKLKHQRGQLG